MANPTQQIPRSERQRILQPLQFRQGQVISRDLPKDTVLKHLILRLSGSVKTTFTGTPVAKAEATFDSLINRIDIKINGGTTIKSVRPHLMHMQQLFSTLIQAERKAQAGASANSNPPTEGGFVFGTTTQITSFAETVLISFQNVYAKKQLHTAYGPESTWLNLKRATSAVIELNCSNYSNVQPDATNPVVTYDDSVSPGNGVSVEIQTVEAQDVPAEIVFTNWKQTTKEIAFSSQATDYAVQLNKGNRLQGLMLFARDSTGKASNDVVVDMTLMLNGQTIIKKSGFQALQADNRARFGVDAKFSGGVSRLDGVAYLDLLQDGDLSSALEVAQPMVDDVQLLISVKAACNITIETQELVLPR